MEEEEALTLAPLLLGLTLTKEEEEEEAKGRVREGVTGAEVEDEEGG